MASLFLCVVYGGFVFWEALHVNTGIHYKLDIITLRTLACTAPSLNTILPAVLKPDQRDFLPLDGKHDSSIWRTWLRVDIWILDRSF